MMGKRLGFIGFGEVAYCYASGLLSTGVSAGDLIGFYPRLSLGGPTVERANSLGVRLTDEPAELAAHAEVVMSVTVPDAAIAAAEAVLPHLGRDHVFGDLNSTAPRVKRELGERAARAGVPFADVAILGGLPLYHHRVPLVSSGPAARALAAALGEYGTPVRVVGDRPGQAAMVKMLRSVFSKSFALLLMETLAAAEAAGLAEFLLDDLERSYAEVPFGRRARRAITSTLQHASRRTDELGFVLEALADLGVRSRFVPVVRELMSSVAAMGSGPCDDWHEAVRIAGSIWWAPESPSRANTQAAADDG